MIEAQEEKEFSEFIEKKEKELIELQKEGLVDKNGDTTMMGLVAEYKKYYDLEKSLKSEMEQAREVKDNLEQTLYEAMNFEGVQNLKTDKGMFYLRDDKYASIKPEAQEVFFEWLRESGFGDLIRPTIHGKTLTSWVNEMTSGKELEEDDELSRFVNVFTKHRVGVRK